jgi:hypothetical protein
MNRYDVTHYRGTDSLPELNEAVIRGRREQASTVRAAIAWIARHRQNRRGRAGQGPVA